MKKVIVPIEVSARHLHPTRQLVEKLFGKNSQLDVYKKLSQPGQFAAKQKVKVLGPKGSFDVRIIGPERKKTQLEISITDSYVLGIDKPKIRISGNLDNTTGGVCLIGPNGKMWLKNGVIIANRHLHIEPELAKKYNMANNDTIDVLIDSKRPLIFKNVVVRSHKSIDKLSFQIDTDEANAACVEKNTKAVIEIK